MMVHPDSHGVSRVPWYSGACTRRPLAFAYAAITRYGGTFQTLRLTSSFLTPRHPGRDDLQDLQPLRGNGCRLDTSTVWADPLSLATTQGISSDFFSSGY